MRDRRWTKALSSPCAVRQNHKQWVLLEAAAVPNWRWVSRESKDECSQITCTCVSRKQCLQQNWVKSKEPSMVHTLLLLLSRFSRVRLCVTPSMAAHQAPPSLGFSRQEYWSGLPFPSPVHESEKWKWSCSVVSDSSRPHGLQHTRLLCLWDFPGKSTGVGCHCLLWVHTSTPSKLYYTFNLKHK